MKLPLSDLLRVEMPADDACIGCIGETDQHQHDDGPDLRLDPDQARFLAQKKVDIGAGNNSALADALTAAGVTKKT